MPAFMRGLSRVEGRDNAIKLSSNENPFGPSPLAVAAATAALDTMHLYPETGQTALRDAIGRHFGLDPERIFCGAGSDQVLNLLVQAYTQPGTEVVFPANGFGKFRLYAIGVGALPVAVPERDFVADVDSILAAVNERTRIVVIANPDNPTSTCLGGSEIRRLHAGLPAHVLLIVDAAYADYVRIDDYEPGSGLDAENVVMSRTFSKIFALAAMRIGWVCAPRHVIDVLERLEPSFPLTAPAMAAAIAALDDREHCIAFAPAQRRMAATLQSTLGRVGPEGLSKPGQFRDGAISGTRGPGSRGRQSSPAVKGHHRAALPGPCVRRLPAHHHWYGRGDGSNDCRPGGLAANRPRETRVGLASPADDSRWMPGRRPLGSHAPVNPCRVSAALHQADHRTIPEYDVRMQPCSRKLATEAARSGW